VVLGGELRAGEVAEVKGFDSPRLHAGVGEGFVAGGDGKRAEVLIREGSEGRFAGSHDRDGA
jgi:hypothetical protein